MTHSGSDDAGYHSMIFIYQNMVQNCGYCKRIALPFLCYPGNEVAV